MPNGVHIVVSNTLGGIRKTRRTEVASLGCMGALLTSSGGRQQNKEVLGEGDS